MANQYSGISKTDKALPERDQPEGLIQLSADTASHADEIFKKMYNFLKDPENKEGELSPTPMLEPMEELRKNIAKISGTLARINELFQTEVINKLR